jgi:EAL domain-containing protein (putative c-di-GMP-specific phosphodiesterase class I)
MRLDGALANSEQENNHQLLLAPGYPMLYSSLDAWRAALGEALEQGRIKLGQFAVLTNDLQQTLHYEAPVRLELQGEWRNAGQFLPWATRLGLLTRIDGAVLEAACRALDTNPNLVGLAINLSDDAVSDIAFHAHVETTLRAHPNAAGRLWIDVLEGSALRHPAAFRTLCMQLRALGCKVGLKHAGQHFSTLEGLHDLGLDYLKISLALTNDDDSNAGTAFLRGLCSLVHSIGMIAIAEQISDEPHARQLLKLGVDGVSVSGALGARHPGR